MPPPPPPAETVASGLFLAPALRTQSDKRLVTLVREGYETAFEEIVRRYGKPLGRYAAAIVGSRAEDVTQDAFSKALLALRRDGTEIELRPWLYRIVRNTALNDLRDRPAAAEELAEAIAGGLGPAEVAEQREELAALIKQLRALPEPQRAAIVMRELEGLGHQEIATALGISGGGARQAIHRARTALRDGLGLLLPLPLLRFLVDHGAEAAAAGTGAGGAVAAGASMGGAGAGGALKLGLATALIAGSVGTGLALNHDRHGIDASATPAAAAPAGSAGEHGSGGSIPSIASESSSEGDSRSGGEGRGGSGDRGHDGVESGDDSGHGGDRSSEPSHHRGVDDFDGDGRGPSASSGPGPSSGELSDDGGSSGNSGPGGGGPGDDGVAGGSGSSSGPGPGEPRLSGEVSSGSGSGSSGSGSGSGSGSSGSGSGDGL
jgi:RNA polymerase sigma factor (sigma-70 family)